MIPARTILSLLLLLFGTFGPPGIVGTRSTASAASPQRSGAELPGAGVALGPGRMAAVRAPIFARPARAAMQPPIPCPDNLLRNPGFEEGFSARGRVDAVIALGWEPWHEVVAGGVARPLWRARRSASPAEGPDPFVQGGLWSQGVADQSVLQSAGVWQRAAVTPGSRLSAAAWGRGWASRGDDPARSVPSGRYLLAIGVDPLGGRDATASRVLWSSPVTVTDTWLPLSIDLPAESTAATIFLRGQPVDALRNNAAHWDGVCLREQDPLAEPAAPSTATPRPSASPDPSQPSPTPDLAQVRATLLAQVAATARSLDLAARATERAGQPAARMAPVFGGIPLPAGGYDSGRLASGPAPQPLVDEQGAAPRPGIAAWLIDRSGIAVIALAALLTGLMLGWGRARDAARAQPKDAAPVGSGSDAAEDGAVVEKTDSTGEREARERKG